MNFSEQINYGEWSLQASFTKIHAPTDKFFVILSDDKREVASFEMVKQVDHWIVIHPAPEWIISFQSELSLLINNTLPNRDAS